MPGTIGGQQVYDRFDWAAPAVSGDWSVMATWLQERPTVDTWWCAVSVVASVDPGVEGALRIRAAEGGLVSAEARIVDHVGPVLLGWMQLQWNSPAVQFISLEGRRTAGAGGGVRVHRAALTMMTAPPLTQRPGPTFPAGQEPPALPGYPTEYSSSDPYGG